MRPYGCSNNDDDDDNCMGGGVCIFANNRTVKAIRVNLPPTFSHLELCVIDIVNNSSCTVRLFVAYRPPGANRQPDAVKYAADLCNCINSLFPPNGTVVLCGDMNFPLIDWSVDNCVKCNDFSCSGLFLSLFYSHNLEQFVLSPTRNDNIFDLVFSNDHNCILNVNISEPFSTSDHNSVLFDILYNVDTPAGNTERNVYYYDFNCADWTNIRLFLFNFNFDSLFVNIFDVSQICEFFYQLLYYCIHRFVPLKCFKVGSNNAGLRYPNSIKKLIRKKATAWRSYRKKKTPSSRVCYNLLSAKCRRAIRSFIRQHESYLVHCNNLGKFYRYANKKFCNKSSIGLIKTSDGILSSDPQTIAETFQQTFLSYFVEDNNITPPVDYYTNARTESILFSETLVRRAIQRMKANSKGGPDGIPPIFFKRLSNFLCLPLANLFTSCFAAGYLPPVWKQAYITPIFKKGARTDSNNYRPVALTCTMCKLMESVIKDQLVQYLSYNNLISPNQHAFLANHSTTTNLLECVHDWMLSLQDRDTTDVIYVDISRAFDSIVFSKLMVKLENYGVKGLLYNWINNFISGRTQRVVISNCFSSDRFVISGVPQGSVLGPILFLIYVNDLDKIFSDLFSLTTKLFADDCKLYSRTIFNHSLHVMQLALNRLCAWAVKWQLVINVLKCIFLCITRSSLSSQSVYFINNVPIVSASSVSDLGVTINHDLTFNLHINNIVSRAQGRLSVFLRGFVTRDFNFVSKAFITYIRPILEFNSIIWSPSQVFLIDLIEKVQRRFSKNVPALSDMPYLSRLAILKLEPLELRRLHFDLVYYYKILNNMTPIDPSKHFIIYNSLPSSRSAPSLLHRPVHGSEKTLSSFFYRNTAAWNSLPLDVKSVSSVSTFKIKLKTVDLTAFMKGSVFK